MRLVNGGNHMVDVGGGSQEEIGAFHSQTHGPKLDLPGALLSGDVQDPQSLAEEFADLQQQGGFTDSRLTAEHDHRSFDNAAAQNSIQLGKVGMEPVLLRRGDGIDGADLQIGYHLGVLSGFSPHGSRGFELLLHSVPLTAFRALAVPLCRLITAVLAYIRCF